MLFYGTFAVFLVFSVVLLEFIFSASAASTVPKMLNYQARLTDPSGLPVPDGVVAIKISLYDAASGGTCLYAMRGTCGTPTAKNVTVTNGVFSTLIGEAGDNTIPDDLFDDPNVYLGLTVAADAEMTPRKRIVSGGYAMNADRLDALDTSSVGGAGAYIPATDGSGDLTITGEITTDDLTVTGTCIGCGGIDTLQSAYANDADGGGATIATDGTDGDLIIAGTQDFIYNGTGNVGIGTTAPGARLVVQDGSASPIGNIFQVSNSIDSSRYFTVSPTSTTVSGGVLNIFEAGSGVRGAVVFDGDGTAEDWQLQNNSVGLSFLNITDGNVYRFSVSKDGDVSIGNTVGQQIAPARLHVRDASVSPTRDIFQIANFGDSQRYFTVSATGASVTNPAPLARLDVRGTTGNTLSDLTQNVSNAGLALTGPLSGFYPKYLPAFVWRSDDNNPTRPKAGIWARATVNGSFVYLGTSNSYGIGITNQALTIDYQGNVGIGVDATTSDAPPAFGARLIAADASGSPTGNIFEIWNNGGSSKYFTVSSTTTRVFNDLIVDGTCTGCGGSSSTLNGAYNASTSTSELWLNPTQGALTIRDTVGDSLGNLFEIRDRLANESSSAAHFIVSSTAVGIGTGTPDSMLHVFTGPSNSANGINLAQGGTNSGRLFLTTGTPGNSSVFSRSDSSGGMLNFNSGGTPNASSGTTRMVLVDSGSLGIGSGTLPTARLMVRDASASPAGFIFQVSNLNDSNRYLTVSSTNTAIGSASNTHVITPNAWIAGDLTPSDDNLYSLGNYNRRWKDLWLSGGTANIAYDTSGTTTLTLGYDTTTGARAKINSNGLPLLIRAGNVGGITVGTDGNTTINGDITVTGACGGCGGGSSTLQQAYDNDADGSDVLITTNATDGDIAFAGDQDFRVTTTGNSIFDTTTFVVDAANNRVGIGTAGPLASLHAFSNASGAGTIQGEFENTNEAGRSQLIVTSGTYPNNFFSLMTHGTTFASDNYLSDSANDNGLGILLGQGANMTKFAVGTFNATPLAFFTNNIQRLLIDSSGNVGIGDTTPDAFLDVAGSFQTDGSAVIGDATTDRLTVTGETRFGQISADPTGANGLTYYNTTTNKFRCFQASAWTDCIPTGGSGNVTASGTSTYGQVPFFTTGTNIAGDSSFYWNQADKKLGIGTSSPVSDLHVMKNAASLTTSVENTNTADDNSTTLTIKGRNGTAQDVKSRSYLNIESGHYNIGFSDDNDFTSGINFIVRNSSSAPTTKTFNLGMRARSNTDSFNLFSDTVTTNGGIMTWLRTGNVGIGDSSPDALLDIGGTFQTDGDATIGNATTDRLTVAGETRFGVIGSDPTGTNGLTYYNNSTSKFRCFEAGAWKDCDTTGTVTTLQSAYNADADGSDATITTNLTDGDLVFAGDQNIRVVTTVDDANGGFQVTKTTGTNGVAAKFSSTSLTNGQLIAFDAGVGLTSGAIMSATGTHIGLGGVGPLYDFYATFTGRDADALNGVYRWTARNRNMGNALTINGFNYEWIQEGDYWAGTQNNTENVFRVALANNTQGVEDTAVRALLLLENADDAAGNQISVSDALRITSAGGSGSISNGINIATTAVTNDLVLQNGETIHNNTDGTITLGGDVTITGTCTGCGTLTTLQQAYDNDANGGNVLITTNATDGKLTIAGTETFEVTVPATHFSGPIAVEGSVVPSGVSMLVGVCGACASNNAYQRFSTNTRSWDFGVGSTVADENFVIRDPAQSDRTLFMIDEGGRIGFNDTSLGAQFEVTAPSHAGTPLGIARFQNTDANAAQIFLNTAFVDQRAELRFTETSSFSTRWMMGLESDNSFFIEDGAGADAFLINATSTAITMNGAVDINSTLQVNLTGTQTTSAVCHTANGQTSNQELVDCDPVAGDYKEIYPTMPDVEAGDIVSAGDAYVISTEGDEVPKLIKTASSYQSDALGVMTDPSTASDFNSVGHNIRAEDRPMPLALVGRVKVKVSGENGPIGLGDPIASGSLAGYGMKAVESGRIVGLAIGSFDGADASATGTVMVYVNPGWWNGASVAADSPDFASFTTGSIVASSGLWSISQDGYLIAKRIEADEVKTKTLTVVQTDDSEAVGEGMVAVGYDAVIVMNPLLKPNSKVFISFNGDPGARHWIAEKGEGNFTLHLSAPAPSDLPFEYWIMNVEDQRTPPSSPAPALPVEDPESPPAPSSGEEGEDTEIETAPPEEAPPTESGSSTDQASD